MCVHANIEPLLWESEFFQIKSAKLNFSPRAPLVNSSKMSGYRLIQAKIPTDRVDLSDALYSLGFQWVTGEVDLVLTIDMENQLTTSRLATVDDIPRLRQVAAEAFAASRFRSPWYHPQDSGRLYALWVEKAVQGTFDDQCLLLDDAQGQPAGFVTLRDLKNGAARIGLLALFPKMAGKGIGIQLMSAAKKWCQQRGLYRLHVATQINNIAALRLYIRSGALIENTAYWLYKGQK